MNKKFLSIAASTAIVASALVFTGCGDSDSSSGGGTPPPVAGTLNATAVKGPWSGLLYTVTTNGTLADTTRTMTGGVFTFGTTADNVTIDLGMAKWKIPAPSHGSAFNFLNIAAEGGSLIRPNGTAFATTDYANVIDNLLLTTLTFENDTAALESTATPYNAATLISRFAALHAQGLDLTKASADFQTNLAAKIVAANLTSVNKTSVATAATAMTAYKTAIKTAYGAQLAQTYAGLNNLNRTMLNNTILIATMPNSTKVAIDFTGFGSGTPANSNLTGATNTLAALGAGNATGSVIKFGSTNMTNLSADYVVFTNPISGLRDGSTVKMRYVNSQGQMTEYTVNAIRTNLSTWGVYNGGTKNANFTVTDSYGNPKVAINLTSAGSTVLRGANVSTYFAADHTWRSINRTSADVANALGSNYTIDTEADMAGLNTTLCIYNSSGGAAIDPANSWMNLTFDFDPAGYQNGGNGTCANGGVIATIVNAVDATLNALTKFFLGVFRVG